MTYKSALQGDEAHTVWVGDVLIRADAVGTDTYELNRNLLLTPEARADSVPNLEIETGEIAGAGHASATGRFDDEQLFYLQSRGIPADVARRMVVRGFFADVVEDLGVPELQERLMATVEAELREGVRMMPEPTRACALSDLPDEGAIRVELGGQAGLRRPQRRRGLRDRATSARTPRSRCPRATSSDGKIECWLHGSLFDLRTGKPSGLPAVRPVPTYPVTVEGDDVLVQMES